MRKLLTFLIALGAIVFAVVSPVPAHAYGYGFQGGCGGYNSAGGFSGGCGVPTCSQATTFLARTSGLSGTETSAYTTLICGLVSDTYSSGGSIWSHLDGLYIAATKNQATFQLNLISTSFGLTPVSTSGSFTFVPDTSISPGGSSNYMDTGVILASYGGQCTTSGCMIFEYQTNTRSSAANTQTFGADDQSGPGFAFSWAPNSGFGTPPNAISQILNNLNLGSGLSATQGLFVLNGSSTANQVYRNGNTTPYMTQTAGSPGLASVVTLWFMGAQDSAGNRSPSGDTFIAFGFGAGFTAADQFKLACRINAYATTFGINTYSNVGC